GARLGAFRLEDILVVWSAWVTGGGENGGDDRLAVVLGRYAFDLRQCASQGRALPRDRRADRRFRAGAAGARARLRLGRGDPRRQGCGGRPRKAAVRIRRARARPPGGAPFRPTPPPG